MTLLPVPTDLRKLRAAFIALPATPATMVLSVLAVIFWLILYRWYSLFDHYSTPYFAFDKVLNHFGSPILRYTTLLFLALVLIYAVIYGLLRTMTQISRSFKLTIVLLVAIAAVVNIGLYPVGAVDVYYYSSTLKLAYYYHQNPYVVTFQAHAADPFARFSFLLGMPSPYGPAWLLLSGLPTIVTGFADVQHVVLGLKAFNLVLLALTALALYKYQDDDKRGWLAAYLFLANPLVLFEGVGNAHSDVLMALFLIAALLALQRQSWLAGPLLALSVLVKFLSAALIPLFALTMLMRRWSKPKLLLSALLSLAVAVVVSAPFWAGGKMVGGLVRGQTVTQGMASSSIFSLVREYLGQQNASVDTISSVGPACIGLFAVSALVILWTVRRGRELEPALVDTFLLFASLLSLFFPWYLIPVLAMVALRRTPLGFAYLCGATALGLVYHPLSVWAWFNSGMSAFQIHLFQALFLTLPVLAFLGLEVSGLEVRMRRSF
jgi:hypothetical protein